MSDLDKIEQTLHRTARRRRIANALRGLWTGLLFGALASLIFSAAYRFLPAPEWLLYIAAVSPLIGIVAGLLAGGWRKPRLIETARWVDQREGLKERISTAFETATPSHGGHSTKATNHRNTAIPKDRRTEALAEEAWRELLVRDAAAFAEKLDPRRVVSFHLAWAGRWAAIVLLLGAGLGFVPEYRSKEYLQSKRDAENIRETGRRLAEIMKRNLEREPPQLESTRAALEEAGMVGERLEARTPNRDEALRELANAADKLRQAAAELSRSPAIRQLQQAARSSGGALRSPGALQKDMQALREQLGGASATPEQLRQIQDKLRAAEHAARAMAAGNTAAPGSKDKVGAALSELSAEAQGLGLDLPQLDEAIRALAADETGLFLKNLEASLIDLEKLAQMAQALQAMQQEAGRLGKNLAEQFTRGQAQAAKETLEKLAGKLQGGKLSAEELEKVLAEVAQAIDPAGDYGDVAKHLQAAADQMKKGRQPGAGESLREAARELAALMEQAGDAQSMLAAMAALREASMCLGTGQCWAPGRLPGNRQGIAGAGVGTWSDAQQTWDGMAGEMPNNLGIDRPEMDARSGLAEPEDATGLTPTKVRGQFSPGGPMPSISLRGVGIKGQSTVAYEEAATAAQLEAQSALGQDKVPRAYREPVKNYFDELKN
jgi:hypothetical protein